ncbi:MAG TPA: secretin N-terminal domain-containing protein [Verrucomicrobiae bacterium]|nr:secretin N-terminal domain-containing protein [Verrucomicrobiae bacterium]
MKTPRLLSMCLLGTMLCSLCFAGGTVPSNTIQVVTAPMALTTTATSTAAPPVVTTSTNTPAPVASEPIEIGYIEADIQNVLRTLAAKAGVNLILGDEVTGKVTVNLKGISYEQAMQLIAESKGYAYVNDNNVVKIKSRESLDVEPIELRLYTLAYAKAEDVKKTLDPVLTRQGKIEVDPRSNTLVLSDTPSSLSKIMPLIKALDTETPQVLIEAKFVETTKNPQKNLGIDWSGTLLGHQLSATGYRVAPGTDPTGPTSYATDPNSGGNLTGFTLQKNLNGGPWSAPYALLNPGNAAIVFNYLNQDTDSELLANPRVVATDNVKTRISIAEQYPIPNFAFSEQTASLQISGFDYKDIGIILTVTPRVNRNDYVTLDVQPEASSSTQNATLQSGGGNAVQIPIINTRTAQTTVLIKSGNTLAIGGLMRVDTSDNYSKVPIMGDAPLLGPLFRNRSLSKTKRDLLIFLTPTIVHPDQQTGYEKYVNGLPNEPVYTNDKWMPKDNSEPRKFFGLFGNGSSKTNSMVPAQNFGPK